MKVDRKKRRVARSATPRAFGDDLRISELPLRETLVGTDEVTGIAAGANWRASLAAAKVYVSESPVLTGTPTAPAPLSTATDQIATVGYVNDIILTGAVGGETVDTSEQYRIIMLSSGTVRAIPYNAVPPEAPTGLARVVRLTSVRLTWNAVAGAVGYLIKRDGGNLATTSFLTYRDGAVTVGQTYSYTVSAQDQYQQLSPVSASVSAFIDPALNIAPNDVSVTVWPTPIPTDGYSYIRVNAREMDVQDLAYALDVDVGSLETTVFPGTWRIRI